MSTPLLACEDLHVRFETHAGLVACCRLACRR